MPVVGILGFRIAREAGILTAALKVASAHPTLGMEEGRRLAT